MGDGGISYVVTDIMVDERYYRQGLGYLIMEYINTFLTSTTDEDAYIILMAKKPADKLYEKFHFASGEPSSTGMIYKGK